MAPHDSQQSGGSDGDHSPTTSSGRAFDKSLLLFILGFCLVVVGGTFGFVTLSDYVNCRNAENATAARRIHAPEQRTRIIHASGVVEADEVRVYNSGVTYYRNGKRAGHIAGNFHVEFIDAVESTTNGTP